jgi:hypothetical protein
MGKSVHGDDGGQSAPSGKRHGRAQRFGAQAPAAKKCPRLKKRPQLEYPK